MTRKSPFILLSFLLLWALPAHSQGMPWLDGWWVSGGGGAALNLRSDLSPEERGRGGVGYLRVAREMNRRFSIGGEWMGGWVEGEFQSLTRQSFTLFAQLGPPGYGGLHVRAGAGVGLGRSESVERPDPGGPPGGSVVGIGLEGTWATTVGLGWEIPTPTRFSLIPGVDVQILRVGARTNTLLAVTVGALFH